MYLSNAKRYGFSKGALNYFACNLPTKTVESLNGNNIDGLMQNRRNSIANALELRLFCIMPSIWWKQTWWSISLQLKTKYMNCRIMKPWFIDLLTSIVHGQEKETYAQEFLWHRHGNQQSIMSIIQFIMQYRCRVDILWYVRDCTVSHIHITMKSIMNSPNCLRYITDLSLL